jgi:hypothetical protein
LLTFHVEETPIPKNCLMGVADIGSHSLHPSAVELLVSSLGVNGINLLLFFFSLTP